MKTTAEIREAFLAFFEAHDHRIVASSPLVPGNDPTLLFTNSGMVQFKDVFLGAEKRPYLRAVSSQRCVRAGGKHNDLDQVGYTARHHTFFEMLGNFSFGDYFKEDAIRFSWDLLTGTYGLPSERMWVTVYQTDDEAYDIWKTQIGVPEERIVRVGDKPGGRKYESDNFWAMGDTGPCGPCTEIFWDHGPGVQGGPPGSPDEDGDRYVEIWNLVFMQFDRAADGSFSPLPAPCVDTGMGLERLSAVLQGVHSNYDTDLFQALIKAAGSLTGTKDLQNNSLKVIADHIRACSFLIADGVVPSNEGRGYVLRRIIRRAIRHGFKLGHKGAFFSRMVEPLAAQMGDAYQVLREQQQRIVDTLLDEEKRFARTLDTGMGILGRVIEKARDGSRAIDGATAFLLYDTYGFPLDLTEDIARENGLSVDVNGFDGEMQKQRNRARAAGQFQQATQLSADLIQTLEPTVFEGYEALDVTGTRIIAMVREGEAVERLDAGERATLILDRTPFYAESGGQIGDSGALTSGDARFAVADTQKLAGVYYGHVGQLESGQLSVGDSISAHVDADRRKAIVLHHSATHLMHAALQDTLGGHVEQKGSLVAPDHLRFDFSHPGQLTRDQLRAVENQVNVAIRKNAAALAELMGYEDALATGAMALFGEKYGDEVRVVRLGDSVELCGGTHVARVGDIGVFKIITESAIGAGVRRIEAVAGEAAVRYVQDMEDRLQGVAQVLKVGPDDVEERLRQLLERGRAMEKEVQALKSKLATSGSSDLASRAEEINGVQVLAVRVDGADARALRDSIDHLKNKLGTAVVVVAGASDGKVRIAAGVTENLLARIKAGDLVNFVAGQVGGRGGGRPDFAQAGGSEPEKLDGALSSVSAWVADRT